jgi:hypothetical protein
MPGGAGMKVMWGRSKPGIWKKTKFDVCASPIVKDTIPGMFPLPGSSCMGKQSAGIRRKMAGLPS